MSVDPKRSLSASLQAKAKNYLLLPSNTNTSLEHKFVAKLTISVVPHSAVLPIVRPYRFRDVCPGCGLFTIDTFIATDLFLRIRPSHAHWVYTNKSGRPIIVVQDGQVARGAADDSDEDNDAHPH